MCVCVWGGGGGSHITPVKNKLGESPCFWSGSLRKKVVPFEKMKGRKI